MSLREYKRKRNFRHTPEPKGNGAATPGRQFVVQKHAASRLHYDFRLELGGTLKSWAVPKGPSLDPAVKSLAVHVEDHPIEYGSFEGVIPEGEYGGGTVMVWDRGTWEPEEDAANGYRKGKLKFKLHGEKLHGSWALVRMGGKAGGDGKNWLLIKHDDQAARPGDDHKFLTKKAKSVLTNREMNEIAADADRVWSSNSKNGAAASAATTKRATATKKKGGRSSTTTNMRRKTTSISPREVARLTGARRAPQPGAFKPQLAVLVADVPKGDEWLHELKFDGYRMLAFLEKGKVRLVTRNGNDWTKKFPTLAAELASLPTKTAILDGEVVSLTEEGLSNFQQLQNLVKRGNDDRIVYYLFDLPHCLGYNLTKTPLVERKELLARVVRAAFPNNDGRIRYSDHIAGQGQSVFAHACRLAMEGVVSKRAESGYSQSRMPTWQKTKCLKRQEFVIGGYTKPTGSRVGFGALLLGHYDDEGRLTYNGRVGTGFTNDTLKELSAQLRQRKVDEPPFDSPLSTAERRGVTWVRPELVGEVEFSEWTEDGQLRHPSFQGLREDKDPKLVVREEPGKPMPDSNPSSKSKKRKAVAKQQVSRRTKSAAAEASGEVRIAGVTISHPDRMLYPEQGLTKRDLAAYYETVGDWILPHLSGRPLTLVRCPAGPGGQCFYQKHLTESLPDAVQGVTVPEKGKRSRYVMVNDLVGLISLVQIGVLEFHPWPATDKNLEAPDRIIFDLDPGPGVPWAAVIDTAREVRAELDGRKLRSFIRTSGGKGLHVVVPIEPKHTWDEVKEFSREIAVGLANRDPKRYVATTTKSKRRGKVFIDFFRNSRGATAVASYSTRARSGAPVSMPLRWEELGKTKSADQFTVVDTPRRLARRKKDPWDSFFKVRQNI
jgi:bifunctional non-homologous end joining protein LigD